jgi:hypothetical protein
MWCRLAAAPRRKFARANDGNRGEASKMDRRRRHCIACAFGGCGRCRDGGRRAGRSRDQETISSTSSRATFFRIYGEDEKFIALALQVAGTRQGRSRRRHAELGVLYFAGNIPEAHATLQSGLSSRSSSKRNFSWVRRDCADPFQRCRLRGRAVPNREDAAKPRYQILMATMLVPVRPPPKPHGARRPPNVQSDLQFLRTQAKCN